LTDISGVLTYTIIKAIIALMMEAISTSKAPASGYQTTRRNIPEDNHLHTRHRENLQYISRQVQVSLSSDSVLHRFTVRYEICCAVLIQCCGVFSRLTLPNPTRRQHLAGFVDIDTSRDFHIRVPTFPKVMMRVTGSISTIASTVLSP
jgi:hypothetical protein